MREERFEPEEEPLSIAYLVQNGTMSAEMAGVLWAAAEEQVSYITVAVPQKAGKSTTANAVLALRPANVAVHPVVGDPDEMALLQRERLGGYLQVAEFSPRMRGRYIWEEPARRVFETLASGYSLTGSLHAPGAIDGFHEVTKGIGVSDERAKALKLVLYIEVLGERNDPGIRRRLADVYEVTDVKGGDPIGQSLFRWRPESDSFEKVGEPVQFGRDRADLDRRTQVMANLALSERTSPEDVEQAVQSYRSLARGFSWG